MISAFFHTAFYNPIYNALVTLVTLVPGSDVGVAIIVLTILIRLLLLPFSLSAARTQRAIKQLEPKIKALKEKYKNDKNQEAIETLALYREAKVNPFASILMAFIQIPILLALYWVFANEPFPIVNLARLYELTPIPGTTSLMFIGLISVTGKSLILSILAGVTQFLQAHMALSGTMKPPEDGSQGSFQRVMGMQLKYVFPFLIGAISYSTSSAIALYFITTNLAGSVQEWHMHRVLTREAAQSE